MNNDSSPADKIPVIQQPQQEEQQVLNDSDYDNEVSSDSKDNLWNEDDRSEDSSELPDRDYIAVVPQHSTLLVDTTLSQAVTLYYKPGSTSNQSKTVIGKVVSCLPNNVMSCAMASRLGIEFGSIVEGDPSFVEFVGGQKRPVMGKTGLIQVHKSPVMNRKCFNMQFWIYEDYDPEMVLGRPFVERRDYYWDKTRGRMPTE
jgi:hypothetical protein